MREGPEKARPRRPRQRAYPRRASAHHAPPPGQERCTLKVKTCQDTSHEGLLVVSCSNVSALLYWYRIDGDHANPLAAWHAMGSPAQPSLEQLALLATAAEAGRRTVPVTAEGTLSVQMPPNSAVVLVFDCEDDGCAGSSGMDMNVGRVCVLMVVGIRL